MALVVLPGCSGDKDGKASYWAKTYGGSNNDSAYSIQQTSDGGYLAAGYTSSFGADASATVQNTSVIPEDTTVTPADSNVTVTDSNVTGVDTDAKVHTQASD